MWLLALDSAPARLGSRSGVFAGYRGDLPEPAEDRDAREAADPMASDWMGDQDCLGEAVEGDGARSFDIDFR